MGKRLLFVILPPLVSASPSESEVGETPREPPLRRELVSESLFSIKPDPEIANPESRPVARTDLIRGMVQGNIIGHFVNSLIV